MRRFPADINQMKGRRHVPQEIAEGPDLDDKRIDKILELMKRHAHEIDVVLSAESDITFDQRIEPVDPLDLLSKKRGLVFPYFFFIDKVTQNFKGNTPGFQRMRNIGR